MNLTERIKRYALFLLGLFILAASVILMIKATLGTTPLATIPYTVSAILGVKIGLCTFGMGATFLLGQILLMRRDFRKEQLLQIPVAFLLGVFQNIWLVILDGHLEPAGYVFRFLLMLLACGVAGLGVALEITANVVMDAAAALTKDIADKFHFDFGRTKVCFDAGMVVIAAVISLAALHTTTGIREGTLVGAFLAGIIAGYLRKKFVFMNRFLTSGERGEQPER
ncbi:MAG: DUF6198 family protein [Peptococcaceae bacterium]|jgi:uncharacterized membrane protein YczE|nr:DUF6198 family protein [Peptococcaceae bacterium]